MTEILFAVGAGAEVAGVCEPVSYPPQAKTLPVVASWDRLEVERVVALAPQACFTVEGMQAPYALSALRRLGLEVDVYPMRSLHDLWACMDAVAARTGHAAEGARVTAGLQKRVATAGEGLVGPPRRALVVVGLDPLVVAGPGSFLNDVLKASGYVNALSGSGEAYPLLSLETAAEAEPQTVVFPKGELPPAACERLTTMVGNMEGRAVTSVFVPADLLVRPGPRTAQAVEILAAARRGEGASRNSEVGFRNSQRPIHHQGTKAPREKWELGLSRVSPLASRVSRLASRVSRFPSRVSRTDQGAGSGERGAWEVARAVVPHAPHLLISASPHDVGPGRDSGVRNSERAIHHQGTKAPREGLGIYLSRVWRLASRVSRLASRVSRLASRVSRLASRVSRPSPRVSLAEPFTGRRPPRREAVL